MPFFNPLLLEIGQEKIIKVGQIRQNKEYHGTNQSAKKKKAWQIEFAFTHWNVKFVPMLG